MARRRKEGDRMGKKIKRGYYIRRDSGGNYKEIRVIMI